MTEPLTGPLTGPLTTVEAPVGIVGAGPIGLIAALRLASFGVPCVLLEAHPELIKQGSKACLIQGDVLEILDKVGCAQPVHDEGVTWTMARTYARNREIRADLYPRGLAFGPFCNISQHRIEQVLTAAVEGSPLCDLRWGHEVTGLAQDAEGVTVRAETASGPAELRFSYLVAADGVRSRLRELLGVEWTGYTHRDRFLITDLRAELPLAKERHFHYDPSFNPGRQLVMHPQPDDIWRVDWQLPPDADIDAERADGRFDERVRKVIGDVPYEVDWVSTYRFHQRVVARMRVGRVLLAGDAAHALPPYGSRGMNSGIQDADNLAWKLAYVLAGRAGAELLETYHTERYAAAKENLAVTEATIRFMVPPNRLRRWTRATLLRLSRWLGLARRHVNSGRMAQPYTYDDSPIVQTGHPMLGSFARDGHLRMNGGRTRLRRLLGAEFVLLVFAATAERAKELIDAARSRPWVVPARVVAVLPLDGSARPLPAGVEVARAEDAEVAQAYGSVQGTWWLVRPDGHLAARGARGEEVAPALGAAIGSPATQTSPVQEGVRL
ncbi:FAD-dependent monooxygenase [Nonomuraea gerenzanensis]|uniref:2-polyprenyl-6-methoxyphenol hydroxylase and related FAD-dependent oxidoreductases n=1 Tax=Nonomuraea gerenzanensis TaxID=93944 RepID=A0A1M4EAR3_9ACTN|nr:FAD-dependent monooxygenase [Nonomuraea gerenzanensis]UBU17872.1 FAD-dependent monooxygenase [Nonomuraea gerenzanensis]SBO95663.1 2-polyprenyl-6-methoxyphenol hydroxylase and related FAD-dependent oxidoreductases [Nonomuraea gerenzanensis]